MSARLIPNWLILLCGAVAVGGSGCVDNSAPFNPDNLSEDQGISSDLSGRDLTGSGGGDLGGGGGDLAPDKRIFPLELGRKWTYRVERYGVGYPYCVAGEQDMTVLRSVDVMGRRALEVQGACPGIAPVPHIATGDLVETYVNSKWSAYLDTPVMDGHSWPYHNTSFTWYNTGPTTVPAGTFTDCFRMSQNVAYKYDQIYCRGVGLVQLVLVDLAGGGYKFELTKRNF